MEYRRFDNTIFARLDPGEDVAEQIRAIALAEDIRLASVNGVGATDLFSVGVFGDTLDTHHSVTYDTGHEIVSLCGSITTFHGEYYAHFHIAAADKEGVVHGGHMIQCRVFATCELTITISQGHVDRFHDKEATGLNLLSFD